MAHANSMYFLPSILKYFSRSDYLAAFQLAMFGTGRKYDTPAFRFHVFQVIIIIILEEHALRTLFVYFSLISPLKIPTS